MPFDAITKTKVPTLLEQIGLTPVPLEVVEPHKRQAEQAALKTLTEQIGALAADHRIHHMSNWIVYRTRTIVLCRPSESRLARCGRFLRNLFEFTPQTNHAPIMRFLARLISVSVARTQRVKAGIPAEALTLADTVHRRLHAKGIEAEFATEVFDTDPILYLELDGEWYCLAIWDYDDTGYPVVTDLATVV